MGDADLDQSRYLRTMSQLKFIRTSDTRTFQPLEWGGRRVLEAFEQIRAFLAAKGDSRLAELLAEPVLAGGHSAALGSVAWYTLAEGDIIPLTRANTAQRREATRQLAEILPPVANWLTEPTFGPLLQQALIVATIEDILLVGNQVVLTNWGLAPPSATTSEARLRQHFEVTLGSYVLLPWPAVVTTPPAAVNEAAIPPIAASEAPVSTVPIESPPRLPHAHAPERASSPPVSVLPPLRLAWYQQPWAWAASGILLLICGLLIGLLVRFMGGRPPANPAANELLSLQQEVNRSLEEQTTRLRKALSSDVCAIDLLPSLLPVPAQSPVLPTQGEPTPATGDQPTQTLAQRLEETTVLILAQQKDGLSMGTGFLIAPGVILTNSHVIGTPGPTDPILVTGKALGGLRKAQLLNATSTPGASDRLGAPDFALLKLATATPPAIPPLPLTIEVAKLEPVVAAGFPGFELKLDPQFEALLEKGEWSAIPEMVVSSGEISVVRGGGAEPTLIAHTAIVSQGNSGGPLVDRCGRVIGINTLIRLDDHSRRQGNYALGGEALLAYLRQHQIPITFSEKKCTAMTTAVAP